MRCRACLWRSPRQWPAAKARRNHAVRCHAAWRPALVLPLHDLTTLEIALDLRAHEPDGLQLFLREQLDLIADVRRAALRRVAVRDQRPRAHRLRELDRRDIAVTARRAHLAVLVFAEADHTENTQGHLGLRSPAGP